MWKIQFKGANINAIDQTISEKSKRFVTGDTRGNIYLYDIENKCIVTAFNLNKISVTNLQVI